MSARSVDSNVSLPTELDFTLPSSLPSARNYEIRVQPTNAQSFTAGNTVQIDVPCGGNGRYLDTTTTYIRFRATFTHAAADSSALIGSGMSFFNRQVVYGNNSALLENINEVGVIANTLFQSQLNAADKVGLSAALGFVDDITLAKATFGHAIQTVAPAQLVFDYCVPIIGILGCLTTKMIPLSKVAGIRYELTMDSFANFTAPKAAAIVNTVTGCVITDFEFVGNVVELSPSSQAIVDSLNPEKIFIRSQSYIQTSSSLPAGTGAGANDILVGIKVSSLKALWMVCSPSNANERKFAGVNPNLVQGTCYVINSQNYPQRTIDPSNKPADAFFQTQKALGSLCSTTFNGCYGKTGFYSASTASGLMAAYTPSTAVGAPLAYSNPSQFYLGIDVETVSRKDNLLSGIDVTSAPIFFRAQIGSPLAGFTHTLGFYGYFDLIIEIDPIARTMTARY